MYWKSQKKIENITRKNSIAEGEVWDSSGRCVSDKMINLFNLRSGIFILFVFMCSGETSPFVSRTTTCFILEKMLGNYTIPMQTTTIPATIIASKLIEPQLAAMPASDRLNAMQQEQLKEAAIEQANQCMAQHGVFNQTAQLCEVSTETANETMRCIIKTITPLTMIITADLDYTRAYRLSVAGSIVSEVSLAILLATYSLFKDIQTSYGRCVVFLSITTMIEQLIQLISLNSKNIPSLCTALAIAHHWALLNMFSWMASIAFDLCFTFSKLRPPSPIDQRRRLRIYALFSEIAPVMIVLTCIVVDYSSHKRYIGYGMNGICFITKYWPDILAFVLPVGCILLFNMACVCATIVCIRIQSNKSDTLFRKGESKSPKRSLSTIVMVSKLSLLLGLGWVLGYIGALSRSVPILYMFVFCNSFQGFFIFVAFCCNIRVFKFYKSRLCKSSISVESSATSGRRKTTETEV